MIEKGFNNFPLKIQKITKITQKEQEIENFRKLFYQNLLKIFRNVFQNENFLVFTYCQGFSRFSQKMENVGENKPKSKAFF